MCWQCWCPPGNSISLEFTQCPQSSPIYDTSPSLNPQKAFKRINKVFSYGSRSSRFFLNAEWVSVECFFATCQFFVAEYEWIRKLCCYFKHNKLSRRVTFSVSQIFHNASGYLSLNARTQTPSVWLHHIKVWVTIVDGPHVKENSYFCIEYLCGWCVLCFPSYASGMLHNIF